MSKKRKYPLPRSECICGICREILLEPVTLPCNHSLCHPCFQLTVEKASLCCPYCRHRVSNWARKNARSGTLVDKELWEIIQRQYPEECERRSHGQDTVDDDFEDASYPAPLICKPGEIRQEYEAEINKIEAERLGREEEECKASEEYIRKLLAEEEEQQRLLVERVQRQSEEQLKRDEELAWMLSSDMNESATKEQSIIEVPVLSKQKLSSKSRKKKTKPKQSGDIERFLSPKATGRVHIQSSAEIHSQDLKNVNSSFGSVCVLDSDEDSMPSLSPQFHLPANGREIQDSDMELQIPLLSTISPIDAAQRDLQVASSSLCSDTGTTKGNKGPSNMVTIDFTPPMSLKGQGDCEWRSSPEFSNVTSTPEQWVKAPKRALESPMDGNSHTTEKRQKISGLENNSVGGLHTERLMQLEDTLIQKKLQEDQDRLLAMKLQKLLDKEQSTVVRRKGSPDEYKLRPKSTSVQPGALDITPLNVSLSNDSKAESSEGDDDTDENKKPAPKKRLQQPQDGVRHSSSRTHPSESVKVLRPSNKQQTIFDMFQRSAGK